jgi:hypothetical protein
MTKAEKQVKYGQKMETLKKKMADTEERMAMLKGKIELCVAKLQEGDDELPKAPEVIKG